MSVRRSRNVNLRLIFVSTGCAAAMCASPVSAADAAAARGGSLHFRAGVVTLPREAGRLAPLCGQDDRGVRRVIQFDGPMTRERRERLRDAGIVVVDYLPTNSYIVRVGAAEPTKVEKLDFIRWHGKFEPTWKVAPEFGGVAADGREAAGPGGKVRAIIHLFADATADEVAAVAAAAAGRPGARVLKTAMDSAGPRVIAEISRADAEFLAGLPPTQFLEQPGPITLRNASTQWITQSNAVNQTPLYDAGLHGEGQVIGVIDDGLDTDHCSFRDESEAVGPLHRKVLANNMDKPEIGFHGTHVACTAAGDDGSSGPTRGMAYAAKLVFESFFDFGFDELGIIDAFSTHHAQGARIHTNSWGDDSTTAYTSLARGIDLFSRASEEDLVVFAVTNLFDLRTPENAKNCLAVGACRDFPTQAQHCSGGVGPTEDGRRKPEIYAPGCDTLSALATTPCLVIPLSGTSMATPAVAGTGALVRQYYTEGFYPSGAANPSDSVTPSGALIKATLLNSTVDMTGVPGFPSILEGWGRVLANNALFFSGEDQTLFVEDVRNANGLETGDVAEHLVTIESPRRLSVTLAFTDVAAAAGAAVAPVNDLGLEVVDPDGAVYLGNVFGAGGSSVVGGAADPLNNVEQVRLTGAALGVWTVRVHGVAVNMERQGYALVVSTHPLLPFGGGPGGPRPPIHPNLPLPTPGNYINIGTIEIPAPGGGFGGFGGALSAPRLRGDLNGDGAVNASDLASLIASFGSEAPEHDLDGDGRVTSADLAILLGAWRP